MQLGRRQPQRLLGMHWGEPAHVTRCCELIRGEQTSDEVFHKTAELAKRLGKDPCLVEKDVPAFIVNRIAYAMYREAIHLLETGVADLETIDRSCRNAIGLWASMCGPFRWIDLCGGPTAFAGGAAPVLPTLAASGELPETLKRAKDEERYGIKNGRGFYDYSEEDIKYWNELLREQSWAVREMLDRNFRSRRTK